MPENLEECIERIDNIPVKENAEIFKKFFLRHYVIEFSNRYKKEVSLGQASQVAYYCSLFLKRLDKPINQLNEKELIEVCEDYEFYINSLTKQKRILKKEGNISENINQKLSKETIKKNVSIIKTFINYLCDNEIIPEGFMRQLKRRHIFQVSWVDKPRYNSLTDINTKERDAIVFHYAKDPFIFAWMSLLRETGARCGEIQNLKIGMVSFIEKQLYAEIILDGKTGKRTIPIINAVQPLKKWLELHPAKDNLQAYVFPKFVYDRNSHKKMFKVDEKISNAYFSQRLKKTAKELGINKFVRPHLFRHLKAFEMKIKDLSSPVANEMMGWSQNSKMFGHYGSGNPETKIHAAYVLAGIKREEKIEDEQFKICGNCKTINSAERLYCQTCNSDLGYARPKTEIPALVAMNSRLDELEKLNQYAFAIANRKIKEMSDESYEKLIKVLE
jgi:integrase